LDKNLIFWCIRIGILIIFTIAKKYWYIKALPWINYKSNHYLINEERCMKGRMMIFIGIFVYVIIINIMKGVELTE